MNHSLLTGEDVGVIEDETSSGTCHDSGLPLSFLDPLSLWSPWFKELLSMHGVALLGAFLRFRQTSHNPRRVIFRLVLLLKRLQC